jgi:amidase
MSLVGFQPEEGHAIGTVFDGVLAWIMAYWIRRLGREPVPGELDPGTAASWENGRHIGAGDYLVAVETLQRFARRLAHLLVDVDLVLTPTLSSPPLSLGEMVATDDDPRRAHRAAGQTVAYSAIVANITGDPAMSVPLWWNADGLPIGVHFLARFGDEATLFRVASQLEAARPWADRHPPINAFA